MGKLLPKLNVVAINSEFFVPSTVDSYWIRDDITRFTRLSPVLKGLAGEFGHVIFWIYASLESGVHLSFPGHGGYPEGYGSPGGALGIYRPGTLEKVIDVWGPPVADVRPTNHLYCLWLHFQYLLVWRHLLIMVLIPGMFFCSHVFMSQWSEKMSSFLIGESEKSGAFWIYHINKEGVALGKNKLSTNRGSLRGRS